MSPQALPPAAREHYRARQRITTAALAGARRTWAAIGDDLEAGWQAAAPRLLLLVTAAQLRAASEAQAYVQLAADQVGLGGEPTADLVPRAFAGTASDGRPLLDLLRESLIRTKYTIGRDGGLEAGLSSGGALLDMIVRTQVADAGRGAESVAMTAHTKVRGYTRMLNPPSCSRCVVLAGRWYKWNSGFRRHPGCDCLHVPAGGSTPAALVRPQSYFDGLTAAEQSRSFGKAGAQAIRDGADLGKVVNAAAGTFTAAGRHARRPGARPRPEHIYAEANGDRSRAIRLLRDAGYLK